MGWLPLQDLGWVEQRKTRPGTGAQAAVPKGVHFPFSVPLRKSFNSAFQQDGLTGSLAQHSFFFCPSTKMSSH